MKTVFVYIYILSLSNFCFGQNFEIDFKKAKDDTSKILLYLDYCDKENNAKLSENYNIKAEELILKNLNNKQNYFLSKRLKKLYLVALVNSVYFKELNSEIKLGCEISFKALKIAEELNDSVQMGYVFNGLGGLFVNQKEYDKALAYYKKSEQVRLNIKDSFGLASVYNNTADLYYQIDNIKKQKEYTFKSFKIRQQLKDSDLIINSIGNIGVVYANLKKYDSAYYFYKTALDYELLHNDSTTAISSMCNIGSNYFDQKKYKQAEVWFLKSYDVSIKTKNLYLSMSVAQRLTNLYDSIRDYKNAYKFHRIYLTQKDLLELETKSNETLKTEFAYQNEKKELEIKSLSQQQQITELESKRKTILIYSICGFIILIALVAYFIFTRYKTKKQNELLRIQLEEANKTVEAEKKAAESELKALKSQMNPHFIFNALNSIQEQFMYGDKIKANEQMGNFTYLTRQILNVSSKKKITLATEMDIITKYLDLEKMRFGADFNYEISCDKNIDEDYHELPPMLIQPFIENSMKHGLLHKTGEKKININFALDDKEEYIICTIVDNGIGRKKSAEIKMNNQNVHSSFSINSIEERLQLLNKELQLKQLIIYNDILDEHHNCIGTKVILLIPLI